MRKILAILMTLIFVFSMFSIFAPQAKATGLPPVGYWKFDEGTGDIAHDSSGNENNGTIHGAIWTSGKIGNALNFTNDYVRIADSPSLRITDSITVMAWVKATGPTNDYQVICARWYDINGQPVLSFVLEFLPPPDGRTPWFRVKTSTSPGATSNKNITYGEWAHIAGTYDGVAIRIYFNGSPAGSTPHSGSINIDSQPIMIGAHNKTSDRNWFSGVIDEVKIYNYSRTQEQIIEDMNIAVGGISIPVNKLELLAPYIGSTILLAVAVMTVGYVKKRKRNAEINS